MDVRRSYIPRICHVFATMQVGLTRGAASFPTHHSYHIPTSLLSSSLFLHLRSLTCISSIRQKPPDANKSIQIGTFSANYLLLTTMAKQQQPAESTAAAEEETSQKSSTSSVQQPPELIEKTPEPKAEETTQSFSLIHDLVRKLTTANTTTTTEAMKPSSGGSKESSSSSSSLPEEEEITEKAGGGLEVVSGGSGRRSSEDSPVQGERLDDPDPAEVVEEREMKARKETMSQRYQRFLEEYL